MVSGKDRAATYCVIVPCIILGSMRAALWYQPPAATAMDVMVAVQAAQISAITERVARQEKLVDAVLIGVFGNLIATIVQIKTNASRRRER